MKKPEALLLELQELEVIFRDAQSTDYQKIFPLPEGALQQIQERRDALCKKLEEALGVDVVDEFRRMLKTYGRGIVIPAGGEICTNCFNVLPTALEPDERTGLYRCPSCSIFLYFTEDEGEE